MNPISPPDFDAAISTLSRWYMDEVRALAAEASKMPEDDRQEWIDQTLDGHEFIIYTFKAQLVVALSDNSGAYEDEIGTPPPTVEAAACMAMVRDVSEMVERMERTAP